MLKRIIHPSALLVTFITGLKLAFSRPQREHILRTADAIIVCEERKTLSGAVPAVGGRARRERGGG